MLMVLVKCNTLLCCRIMLPSSKRDGVYCLSFYYNMNGYHINTLQVAKRTFSGQLINLWTKKHNQGPQWHAAQVTATVYSSEQVSMTVDTFNSFFSQVLILVVNNNYDISDCNNEDCYNIQ